MFSIIIDKGADKALPGSVTSGKHGESSRRVDNEIEAVESPNRSYAKIARECYRDIFIIVLVSLQDCGYKNLSRYFRTSMQYSRFYNVVEFCHRNGVAMRHYDAALRLSAASETLYNVEILNMIKRIYRLSLLYIDDNEALLTTHLWISDLGYLAQLKWHDK